MLFSFLKDLRLCELKYEEVAININVINFGVGKILRPFNEASI